MNTQSAPSFVKLETASNTAAISESVAPIIPSDASKDPAIQVAPMVAAQGDDDLMSQKQFSTVQ
jgi:Mg/Co/Ni transporter MgtE